MLASSNDTLCAGGTPELTQWGTGRALALGYQGELVQQSVEDIYHPM